MLTLYSEWVYIFNVTVISMFILSFFDGLKINTEKHNII